MHNSRILVFVFIALIAVVVAGCGGDDDARTTHKTTTTQWQGIDVDLTVALTHIGDTSKGAGLPVPTDLACTKSIPATCHRELTCSGTDSFDDPTCAWIAKEHETIFAAPADDQACTEIYGGPEVAHVTGTIDGKQVDTTFTRTNGCEIARYDAAAPLWSRESVSDAAKADA